MWKSRTWIRQADATDCGAACLATVARVHGVRVPIARVRQYAGTNMRGTSVLGLVEAARRLGFDARGVRGSMESLERIPLPCIAHVIHSDLFHYVTILEVTGRSIVVADPARGIVRHPVDHFRTMWTGVLVLLVPSPTFRNSAACTARRRGLSQLLRQSRFLIFEALLATVFLTLLGLGTSLYLQVLVDSVLLNRNQHLFRWLSAGLVLLTLARASFGAIRGALHAYMSRAVDLTIMLDYYRHVLAMPLDFHQDRASGEILSRLADAVKIRAMICSSALTLLVDTATIAAGFGALFLLGGRLAFPVLVVVAIMASSLYAVSHPLRGAQRSVLELAAGLQSRFVESLAGIATLKAFRAEESEANRADRELTRLLDQSFRATLWGVVSGISGEVSMSLGIAGLLWSAGWMVLAGDLSIGRLVACYSILLYMLQPVSRLSELNQQIQDAWIAAERLYEILDLRVEREGDAAGIALPDGLPGELALTGVGFRYGSRDAVLRDITLSIRPCSLFALIGDSGSGKSTLARLLLRFHDPQAGQIRIDGHDLRELSLDSLRSRVGYVDQDAFLFSGTIRENLTLGNHRHDADGIARAIGAVGLREFISQLPRGLETRIGERGIALSSGQRQRLALARALVSDPPILVLDEATSHLDLAAERLVLDLVRELKRRKTIIMIGHHLGVARHADRIALLSDGRILEQGTHAELLAARGSYWLLWQSYLEGLATAEES